MAGPPKDVPPNELFLKLMERPRPGEEVPFQGLDQPGGKRGLLRIEVLSKEQHDRARLMAHAQVKKNASRYGLPELTANDMSNEAVKGVISDLAACEVLAMAVKSPTPMAGPQVEDRVTYPYVFGDGEQVGKTLSADEVAYLFSAYTMVQHKYGPHEALVTTNEDINAWVARLKLGASDYPFLRLSSPQWAELLMAFAERLYALSGILESQWDSLPESLRSALQTYCLGTGSAGEQPASLSPHGTDASPGEISFEQAMRVANLMRSPVEDPRSDE